MASLAHHARDCVATFDVPFSADSHVARCVATYMNHVLALSFDLYAKESPPEHEGDSKVPFEIVVASILPPAHPSRGLHSSRGTDADVCVLFAVTMHKEVGEKFAPRAPTIVVDGAEHTVFAMEVSRHPSECSISFMVPVCADSRGYARALHHARKTRGVTADVIYAFDFAALDAGALGWAC